MPSRAERCRRRYAEKSEEVHPWIGTNRKLLAAGNLLFSHHLSAVADGAGDSIARKLVCEVALKVAREFVDSFSQYSEALRLRWLGGVRRAPSFAPLWG